MPISFAVAVHREGKQGMPLSDSEAPTNCPAPFQCYPLRSVPG